jgi:hypothetical protein
MCQINNAVGFGRAKAQQNLLTPPFRAHGNATTAFGWRHMRRAQNNIGQALRRQSRKNAIRHKLCTRGIISMLQLAAAALRHMATDWGNMAWSGRNPAIIFQNIPRGSARCIAARGCDPIAARGQLDNQITAHLVLSAKAVGRASSTSSAINAGPAKAAARL